MMKTIVAMIALASPLMYGADNIIPIDVKPGLWETTMKTEMNGATMQMPQIPEETLNRMPPEQRARVEAMMKGRGSLGNNTTRSCITKDMIAQGLAYQKDKSCTYKLANSSASKQEIHVECTRGPNQTNGDLVLDRVDSEHVKGNMVMKVSNDGRGAMNMKMAFESKFISSDCGSVKPGESESVKK